MAKLIQVIETQVTIGRGTDGDPMRAVTQYWTPAGELLAERDPLAPLYDAADSAWVLPVWMKTKIGSPVTERMRRAGLAAEDAKGE